MADANARMADANARIDQAAALHRQAVAVTDAAAAALDGYRPPPGADLAEQHELAESLAASAAKLVPGWLGAALDSHLTAGPYQPIGGDQRRPKFVRVGMVQASAHRRFPAVIPLLGVGNLTFTADSRDPRVAGVLRSTLLRLLATAPAGSLIVRTVDAVGGALFAPFEALCDAGLMPPPVTDRAGLRTVLTEAEHWVRPGLPETQRRPATRPRRRDCTMLLVIAALPSSVDDVELSRIAALAQAGPAAGLYLIVAGWPPAFSAGQISQPPLPMSTQIALRNRHALIGGVTFAPPQPACGATDTDCRPTGPAAQWSGLSLPVLLDPDPPAAVLRRVCDELAARFAKQGEVHLMDLLPDPDDWWSKSSADGLSTTVGLARQVPIQLHFADSTPHWLVSGRRGGGKTAFLTNVLYGLSTRYDPDELALYLLAFEEGMSFAEFTSTPHDRSWLPHARAVSVAGDREYGLAVLRELDAELTRRSGLFEDAGVARFGQLRALGTVLPRIVCVIDEFHALPAGADPIATEAMGLVESLARKGRSCGLHLILCTQTAPGNETRFAGRDSIFGQFPVRVALPGGGGVLEATNDAAAALPPGSAVVNTAGGLGGPRGATRGHEKTVRFPDPYADEQVLAALRRRLWQAREPSAQPPIVFAGCATAALPQLPVKPPTQPLPPRLARPADELAGSHSEGMDERSHAMNEAMR